MRVLPSVSGQSVADILDRLTVLYVCREAMEAGVKIGSIPKDAKDCRTVVKQILQKFRPDMSCIVRNYVTKETARHRLVIGTKQFGLCPWAIQLQPLGMVPGAVSISTAIKNAIPTWVGGDYLFRTIGGIIGEYCRANGFSLSYRVANNVDDVILLATLREVNKTCEDQTREMARILRENLISPVAFCRAVCMVYDAVSKYKVLSRDWKEKSKRISEELGAIHESRHGKSPKAASSEDKPDLSAIFQGNEEERNKRFREALATIGGGNG